MRPSQIASTALAALTFCVLASSPPAAAQSYALSTLYAFGPTEGTLPTSLILGSDGSLYGTTALGGDGNAFQGTVFRLSTHGAFRTLATFHGSDGSQPTSLVQGRDGNFYGTTQYGGAYGGGTVFRLDPTGALSTVFSFPVNPNGLGPQASPLIQAIDGNLYGTTFSEGGAGGQVFRLTPGGQFTSLVSFDGTNAANGFQPRAGLLQGSDGGLYGTTSVLGAYGAGTVFRVSLAGDFRTLASVPYYGNQSGPTGALVQGADGSLYGVSRGISVDGGVFSVSPGGALTTLTQFAGANPLSGIVLGRDSNFYGTINSDYLFAGSIYQLKSDGTLTSLVSSYDSPHSGKVWSSLLQASDATFYGIAGASGPDGGGTVFRFGLAPAVPEASPPTLLAAGLLLVALFTPRRRRGPLPGPLFRPSTARLAGRSQAHRPCRLAAPHAPHK